MIRDITLGQYYPSGSILHKLDARVKLFATIIFIISLFLFKSIYIYIPISILIIGIIKLSKVPFKYIFKGLKPIFTLLIITILFNIFLFDGEVLVRFWIFKITKEGLLFAIFMGLRLILLVVSTSIMSFTTTPNEITDGIEKSLGFLSKIKVPIHEIAMMMSIALRFIPILMEEVDKIMKAQTARCASFDEGNLFKRIKSMLPILIPLFFSAFRRADDLTEAMESRCYVCGNKRTKMKPLLYKKCDYIAYLLILLYLTIIIGVRFI